MRITVEERLLLIVLALTLGAAMLLISAGQGSEAGHRPWQPGSVLHFVTRLMNFDYGYPTPKGVTVKRLAAGVGAAAALVITALMWARRHSPRTPVLPPPEPPADPPPPPPRTKPWHAVLSAVDAAQFALLAFVAWAFLSAIWSNWSEVAIGESALLAMGVAWAVCLGRALSRRAAAAGAVILAVVLVVTAVVGLWYYAERNPEQRLKFPVGNPLFLAACLLPGVLLAASLAVGSIWTAITERRRLRILWAVLAVAALLVLFRALRLTGSRGALYVGLPVGVWSAVFLLTRRIRASWRKVATVVLIVVALGGVYAGYRYAQSKINDIEGGRGATLRLRLYGWRYAWRLFLNNPAKGLGQGGYSLVVDAVSRRDAENDPAAFVGDRMVHAHSEWFESLADLGAIGIALLAVGYGVTFWACRHVIEQRRNSLEGWCLLGLVASLAAIMAEEATDVGLRFPGLPVVWYTVLGLAWATMRGEDRPTDRAVPFPRPALWAGTGAAFAAAVVMFVWAVGDWQGALAEGRVRPLLNEKRWADAIAKAEASTQYRLVSDEITTSLGQKALCYAHVGAFRLTTFQASTQARPFKDTEGTPVGNLQRQDLDTAQRCIVAAHDDTALLLSHAPSYPYVAGELGRLLLYWVQVAGEVGAVMTTADAEAIAAEGKNLILREYNRNRLNVEAALRCVAAWPDRAMSDRIEWMCTALRGCPVPTGTEPYRGIAEALMNEPGFDAALEPRVQIAQASAAAPRPDDWQDRFAPETLRFWAIALSARARFADAAGAVEPAIRMYALIRIAQPAMLPIAIAEQAWYVFLADPDHPQEARRLARLGLSQVPPIGSRERLAEPIRRSLVLYCLADGAESEAAPVVAQMTGSDDQSFIMHQLGLAYVELAGQFIPAGPEGRPKGFALWLDRASELAPDSTTLQFMLAQVAFESGRDGEVVAALEKAESLGVEPERIDEMIQHALAKRPDSKPLLAYAEERRKEEAAAASRSAATPETQAFSRDP